MVGRLVPAAEVAANVVSRVLPRVDIAPRRSARPPEYDECSRLADIAVAVLLDEARLTPKPALVDMRGGGAHTDLDLALMIRSANSLRPSFAAIAAICEGRLPTRELREELAAIGRAGERAMMRATRGSNAHRGALWTLGLLVAGTVMAESDRCAGAIAGLAAVVARYPDRFAPAAPSNGSRVWDRFGVRGARGEAAAGFPHAVEIGLPQLAAGRVRGYSEDDARLDTLLSIMCSLDDTCLLHRGGRAALARAKTGARAVLARGGVSSVAGRRALLELDADLRSLGASPGGSADLLAAVLLLDRVAAPRSRDTRQALARI